MKINVTDSTSLKINLDDSSSVSFDITLNGNGDIFLVELAKSIQRNSCITSICFGYKRYCPITSTCSINGWKALFRVFQINTTIQKLEFSDCNLNLEWAQLFATMVLFNNNTINDLRIWKSTEIGMNGICGIVNALCNKPAGCTLTSLTLRSVINMDNFNNDTVMGTQLGKAFVTLLQLKSTELKKLDLRYNDLTDAVMDMFVSGLKFNTNLEQLYLSENTLSPYFNAATALANAMYYNRTLRLLDLSWNAINQDGANEIFTALRYHPSLQLLAVDFNRTEGVLGETLQLLKYNEVINILDNSGDQMMISFFDTATVKSILDYNDTIYMLPKPAKDHDYDEEWIEYIDELLTKNLFGQRTAIKKGVPRRQDSFMWLYNSWISTCHNTTT
jgi:Leucine Rich repeat